MCLICVEWQSGKLTSKEAFKNIGELIMDEDKPQEERNHLFDLSDKILEKDLGQVATDDEMDEAWYKETHES